MASSSTKLRFLTTIQVKQLYSTFIANAEPTQPSMLESAIASPMNTKHYAQENNVFKLAANLSEKIMKNHAFADGNKRAALLAADMFLKINGFELQSVPFANDESTQSLAAAHVAVTTGKWDVDALSAYYTQISKPIKNWTPDILAFRSQSTEY